MNNSARLPAKLTCSEGAEKAIQEPTIEEIGHSGQEETHTREKSKICESCLAVSKISAEVEICLQTIVSEYEMELKRLRDRLDSLSAIYRNPRLNVNTACSAGLVARTGSETCDCHLYRNIPGFKDEMRKLGDKNSVNSKDSAIMYYEAAALNGCAESCIKVAMYSLNLDSPESVDYIKAKVLILVIRICRALSFFLNLLHSLHRNFWRGRRDSDIQRPRTSSRCFTTSVNSRAMTLRAMTLRAAIRNAGPLPPTPPPWLGCCSRLSTRATHSQSEPAWLQPSSACRYLPTSPWPQTQPQATSH